MKPKILFIIPSLSIGGGAESIASRVVNFLNSNNYEIHVLKFYDFKEEYKVYTKTYSCNETPGKGVLSKLSATFTRLFKLIKIVKKERYNLIISFMEMANIYAILLKVLLKNKLIISSRHNFNFLSYFNKRVVTFLYPLADVIISQSKEASEHMQKAVRNKAKVITIYNPHDIDSYILKAEEFNIATDMKKVRIISCGRMNEVKNHYQMLRIFSLISTKENVELILLGDGPLKTDLKNFAKDLGIDSKINFLGKQKNIYPYLSSSSIFILTSFNEGLPNTLIEALSQNLIVFSVDCKTGPAEILAPHEDITSYPHFGKYGILLENFERDKNFAGNFEVQPPSEKEKLFANTILEVINSEELKAKYSNGSIRANDFNTPIIMKQWTQVIDTLYEVEKYYDYK